MRQQNKWSVSGLRTRYYPRSRIGQGLISMAPWLNLVLLILFFVMLDSKLVLKPGIVVDLPRAPFREGTRSDMIAVVLSVAGTERGVREEIVFFNDVRFRIRQEGQMENLKQAFAAARKRYSNTDFLIQADHRVPNGTIVDLMNIAREAGIKRVVMATKPL